MGKKYKLSQLLETEWNRSQISPAPPVQNPNPRIKQLSLLEELGWQPEESCSGANPPLCSGADLETPAVARVLAAPEQKTSAPEQKHWVETYHPSNRPQYQYFRYVWMEGRKLRHLHIKGGDTDNPKAIAMKQMVVRAIAIGMSPMEIQNLIKSAAQLL